MKKSGFTMIELIFVIVIIGILASVAIPKLAATRTDAKVSTISQEIQSAVSEITAHAVAQGGEVNATDLKLQSQVLNQLATQGKAKPIAGNDENYTIYGDGTTGCVRLEANDTAIKVETNATANGLICKGIKNIIHNADYTIAGSSVKF